ncbi:SH3 domain-containing protein [Actinomadura barringtoniae]|uniref:SH3 domain-containing protein n=1 Tax=Actinomadura barringtoniae TaxID=1427535 RepID=A0A939P8W0_9ACTN|nr:SH3 domain-containing protein [Actinomadura barringtoniae]MBO2448212.1 SH3 domain-containing protein [Actinomadura barringtoniae]
MRVRTIDHGGLMRPIVISTALAAGLAGSALTVPAAVAASHTVAASRTVASRTVASHAVVAPAPSFKVNAKSGLKVRSGPGSKYKESGSLRFGTVVAGTGKTSGSWTQIRMPKGGVAWAPSMYLTMVKPGPPPKPKPKPTGVAAFKVTRAGVNLRTAPNTQAKVINVLRAGGLLASTGQVAKGWTQVSVSAGGVGWVAAQYLAKTTNPVYRVVGSPGVNVRAGAGVKFKQIAFVKTAILLPGTGTVQSGWAQLNLSNGLTGFASRRYLSQTVQDRGDAAAPAPAATPDPASTPDPADCPEDAPNPNAPAEEPPAQPATEVAPGS